MNETYRNHTLNLFTLTPAQKEAAIERERDIVVTAGAGSGKTSTLTARFVSLLADGIDLRRIVAITFSEKAAKEMRSRVRAAISDLSSKAETNDEREFWSVLSTKMDSARISTIHSLCAEILRSNPVEAVVDPLFEVLDESLSASLRQQVVEDTLSSLVDYPEFEPLLLAMPIEEIRTILALLLNKRYDARKAFNKHVDFSSIVHDSLAILLQTKDLAGPIHELREWDLAELAADAGEPLAEQISQFLDLWTDAEAALGDGDVFKCIGFLFQARRTKMNLQIGKRTSSAKEVFKSIRGVFDDLINPITGGAKGDDVPPDIEGENTFAQLFELLKLAFIKLYEAYSAELFQLSALDFDDLEFRAADLLKNQEIAQKWQAQVDALLVDEFQDTNQNQREIVEAIAGTPGKLFVVGDAKQSIYRFRNADVSVFRAIRQSINQSGGKLIDLDLTFRSHNDLVKGMNDILEQVMGSQEDLSRPFYEPFAPLKAFRQNAREGVHPPDIEFVLGFGDNVDEAKPHSAKALAARLLELQEQGQIKKWDDVALLFRASSGFQFYEEALEEAGIPFVTVAGQGFYDRPEIRDVLNILHALADPADDLSMAGLLRSPAFGVSDAGLYQLRWKEKNPIHFLDALEGDLAGLSEIDKRCAERARQILRELLPLVDRIPVADLLRKVVNSTDYRAILAVDDDKSGGERLWRNLDKLIEDADASGKVNVRDFLDYLTAINDAGAREGDAPAEAQGAICLMTIHKAKGLEFPVVVLADASHGTRGGSDMLLLQPELGISFKLDPEPIIYRLGKLLEKKQAEAEEHRILYVSLTRAEEKLIINGYVTANSQGWSGKAWLNELAEAAGVDLNSIADQSGTAVNFTTTSGSVIRGWTMNPAQAVTNIRDEKNKAPESKQEKAPIFMPLQYNRDQEDEEAKRAANRSWRASGKASMIPPEVVGKMVHKAIELWIFPGDKRLEPLLETQSLDAGIVTKVQRDAVIAQVKELLSRFHDHPLCSEISNAKEVHHEVPYSREVGDHTENGYIDILYRVDEGWQIVDFKTDLIRGEEHRDEVVWNYSKQLNRYSEVVESLLGYKAHTRICFFDADDQVEVVEVG